MGPMIAGAGAGGGRLMEKQSLVPAVEELWNAWEIHCLILISLFLQVFLFLFAGMRRYCHGRLLSLVLWLAYLSADNVAVFVLGHLAVRAGEPGHELRAFWAPFVLVHLGGQDTITAFAKQDNELYRRHLLNLVIQAAVAGYVVAKASWSDGRLKAAMVLMFLCGCFKYAERICCLYSADPELLRGMGEGALSRKLIKGMQRVLGNLFLTKSEGTREEAGQRMEVTLSMMSKGSSSGTANEMFWDGFALVDDIISMDTPLNQAHNIILAVANDLPGMLGEFLHREDHHNAYEHVGEVLGHCYRRLYTKTPIRVSVNVRKGKRLVCRRILFLLWIISPCVPTSIALALFMAAEKGDQLHHANRVDILVSYILLVGAIVLDVFSATIFILTHLSNCTQPAWSKKQWSQELGQYNMTVCVVQRNSALPILAVIQRLLPYDVTCPPRADLTSIIKEFILDTLLLSGKGNAWNIASTRGQLALHSRKQEHPAHYARMTLEAIEKTITSGVDFPISVLIWHIATDICYYSAITNNPDQVEKHKQISRELSNYIMYLVYKCRVMLTTNSQLVHDHAKDEIERILSKFPKDNLGDAVMRLFENQMEHEESGEQKDSTDDVHTDHEESTNISNGAHIHLEKLQQSSQDLKSPVLPRARALAQELIKIEDEAARWELIAAVWAEMLYYVAPRCGGGFHYEHLSTGGEFVTHVLVLMYYLGPFLPLPNT